MNTIDVYENTTTAKGFKHDLMMSFYQGVNKTNNQDWQANLITDYKVSTGTHAFVSTIKEL